MDRQDPNSICTPVICRQNTQKPTFRRESLRSPMSFLDLPFEIRDMVFSHVFESPSGRIRFELQSFKRNNPIYQVTTAEEYPKVINLSLLYTNRQLYNECRDLLWKYNTVTIAPLHLGNNSYATGSSLVSTAGLHFQTDERIMHRIQCVSMAVDMTIFSCLNKWFFQPPESLEIVFKQLGSWKNLQTVFLHLASHQNGSCFLGHEAFMGLVKNRRLSLIKDENRPLEGVIYKDYFRVFSDAGKRNGYLSHVTRHIILKTGSREFTLPCQDSVENFHPYAERVIEDELDPDGMLLELNKAFGGGLCVDYMLNYLNGKRIQRATVPIGNLDPGIWCFLHQNCRDKRQWIRGKRGFQYGKDVAQLFNAKIIAAISNVTLYDALSVLYYAFPNYPDYPLEPMLPSQKEATLAFAEGLFKRNGMDHKLKSNAQPDLDVIRLECISGIRNALAINSEHCLEEELEHSSWDEMSDVFQDWQGLELQQPNGIENDAQTYHPGTVDFVQTEEMQSWGSPTGTAVGSSQTSASEEPDGEEIVGSEAVGNVPWTGSPVMCSGGESVLLDSDLWSEGDASGLAGNTHYHSMIL